MKLWLWILGQGDISTSERVALYGFLGTLLAALGWIGREIWGQWRLELKDARKREEDMETAHFERMQVVQLQHSEELKTIRENHARDMAGMQVQLAEADKKWELRLNACEEKHAEAEKRHMECEKNNRELWYVFAKKFKTTPEELKMESDHDGKDHV